MYTKTIESAFFNKVINKYQQLNANIENTWIEKRKQHEEKIMNSTYKLKSIWNAFFQTPNTFLVQKSMKHVNAYENEDKNEYRKKREKNNESVRKSRAKNRVKIQECAKVVAELKMENTQLNNKLSSLQTELFTLKNLFQHSFSINLTNLAIKPSDIPTSTLCKIIMKNEQKKPSESLVSQLKGVEFFKNKTDLNFNDTDNFYMNQIKKALTNITDQNKIVVENNNNNNNSNNSNVLLERSVSTRKQLSL